jgi:hypothetical protein
MACNVRDLLNKKTTTLEDLKQCYGEDRTSLGVIKPKLQNFRLKDRVWDKEKRETIMSQTTLTPTFKADLLDKRPEYTFNCGNEECNIHNIICEDMEAMILYKKMKDSYNNDEIILEKVKQKLFDFMKERDLFFIMGSHFRFPTFIVISLIYPKYYGESLEKFF